MTLNEEIDELYTLCNDHCFDARCDTYDTCWKCYKYSTSIEVRFYSNFVPNDARRIHYALSKEESLYILLKYPNLYAKYARLK